MDGAKQCWNLNVFTWERSILLSILPHLLLGIAGDLGLAKEGPPASWCTAGLRSLSSAGVLFLSSLLSFLDSSRRRCPGVHSQHLMLLSHLSLSLPPSLHIFLPPSHPYFTPSSLSLPKYAHSRRSARGGSLQGTPRSTQRGNPRDTAASKDAHQHHEWREKRDDGRGRLGERGREIHGPVRSREWEAATSTWAWRRGSSAMRDTSPPRRDVPGGTARSPQRRGSLSPLRNAGASVRGGGGGGRERRGGEERKTSSPATRRSSRSPERLSRSNSGRHAEPDYYTENRHSPLQATRYAAAGPAASVHSNFF